jgi:transcriptional antiterminator NusG
MSEHENQAKWYVVHTYSGYENKVKANIEKLVENRGMQDVIQEVSVPLMDEVEVKNGQKKVVQHKIFPGYVLVKMIMNDDSWYVVRNTRGVTSFVGPGSKPVPLTEQEVYDMGIETFSLADMDYAEGDTVVVKTGPFAESTGIVKEVNLAKRSVIVGISIFGRETPMELDFNQVQLLD